MPGGVNYDLNSLALLMRDWADDPLLAEHHIGLDRQVRSHRQFLIDHRDLGAANPA